MQARAARMYQVHEFAALAGVTVRALHHYDRLGLLKPGRRTASGYRLYGERDFARLEQIVVLKFLGLPLKEIRRLLKGESALAETLARQQVVLAEKRRQLDTAIRVIRKAERALRATGEPDYPLLQEIIKEIEMQNDSEWTKKYYSLEAQAKVEERKAHWSPELQAKVSQQWSELLADIEAALGEDPASPKAQALAARWRELVEGFTGGDQEIQKGLNKMWTDQQNWPEPQHTNYRIKAEIMDFMMQALRVKPPNLKPKPGTATS